MPIPLDDPKFAELRAAGIQFTNQDDARLFWLERALAQLEAKVEQLERQLEREVATLGDGPEHIERRLEGEQLDLEV
jgi:hypothetical protein